MLTVVTWLWNEGFRDYAPHHVNVLARMFARHMDIPHRVVCVTDEVGGFDPGITVVRTPGPAARLATLRTPEGPRFPTCYRRLWTFSREATDVLGERILLCDVDLLLARNVTHLAQRTEDFVGWRPRIKWGNHRRVGGGLFLLRAGARAHVWDRFQGQSSIAEAHRAGYRGSDQAWLSYALQEENVPTWPHSSGIYSIRDLRNGALPLPADAALVQFNGPTKPWASQLAWAREHWR